MKSALRTFLRWGLFTRWMSSAVVTRTMPGPALAAVCLVPGNSLLASPLLASPVLAGPALAGPVMACPVTPISPVLSRPVMAGPVVNSPARASTPALSPARARPAMTSPAMTSPPVASPAGASSKVKSSVVASSVGPDAVGDSLMTACPAADSPVADGLAFGGPVDTSPVVASPVVASPVVASPEVASPVLACPADSLVRDAPATPRPEADSPAADPAPDRPSAACSPGRFTSPKPARPARPRWPARVFRHARFAGLGRSAGSVDMDAAAEFIRLHRREVPGAGPVEARLREIRREISLTGTYRHTLEELEFGARVAWRNSSRCIGRLYWKSLKVRDRREVDTASGIAEECAGHLRAATNHGRVRPTITVFAPDTPARRGPRIWNEQLVRDAGHRQPDGSVRGEPFSAELTDLARELGWATDGQGRFDVLPLIISTADQDPQAFDVPADAVTEVHLIHPRFPWFGELALRWYAVPVICDMCLEIGGIC